MVESFKGSLYIIAYINIMQMFLLYLLYQYDYCHYKTYFRFFFLVSHQILCVYNFIFTNFS